jgi:hypothetical protein
MPVIDELNERRTDVAIRRDNALAAAKALSVEIDELDRIIAAAQPAADQWAQEKLNQANAPTGK